jgi:hypothetical protein
MLVVYNCWFLGVKYILAVLGDNTYRGGLFQHAIAVVAFNTPLITTLVPQPCAVIATVAVTTSPDML